MMSSSQTLLNHLSSVSTMQWMNSSTPSSFCVFKRKGERGRARDGKGEGGRGGQAAKALRKCNAKVRWVAGR
jgi:hypothetical protein